MTSQLDRCKEETLAQSSCQGVIARLSVLNDITPRRMFSPTVILYKFFIVNKIPWITPLKAIVKKGSYINSLTLG